MIMCMKGAAVGGVRGNRCDGPGICPSSYHTFDSYSNPGERPHCNVLKQQRGMLDFSMNC